MWSVSANAAGLAMAAMGCTSTGCPSTIRNPAGVFIQALAMTTKMPERTPEKATIAPAARWVRGGIRFHPYR